MGPVGVSPEATGVGGFMTDIVGRFEILKYYQGVYSRTTVQLLNFNQDLWVPVLDL